ncbi:MAG: hypothetical protein HY397_02575 [Candidatus Doudnabacteria bacterium]|nr:hypothetical protein [Candidatus Doudnabacteria bacterium]
MADTCVAKFADATTAGAAYQAYLRAQTNTLEFLGFRLPPPGLTPDDTCWQHHQYLIFPTEHILDFPLFDEPVEDMLLTPLPVLEALWVLVKGGGWSKLLALPRAKQSSPCGFGQNKKRNRRQKRYAFYAEFGTPKQASAVKEQLVFRPFERWDGPPYVLSAEPDPNPCCVKIVVTSASKKKIRKLGLEFKAARITCNHKEVYRRRTPVPVQTAS